VRLPVGAGKWLGVPLVAALAATWRLRVVGGENEATARAWPNGCLYVIWHEALLPLTWHHRVRRDITMLVSATIDGDYLMAFGGALGYRAVRGATRQDGLQALREVTGILRAGRPVAIAPDGPLGPRRVLKPGVLVAAQRAEAKILPLHVTTDRGWRFGSWDRFLVPKPFARVTVRYGTPFGVEGGEAGLEAGTAQLAGALAELTREDGA
jgi:lysophospholipid acyltransferase (LPLAT)-like uncharacterized protein